MAKEDEMILAHKQGQIVLLTLVEDVSKILSTERISEGPSAREQMECLIGVPVLVDKAGRVWPRPAPGWSIWRAKPVEESA